MSDYVKRKDVVDFIRSYRHSTDVAFHMEEHLDEVPAADVVKQKHGKWKDSNYNLVWNADGVYKAAYQCSNCGACSPIAGYYCHNCGARMDGDSDV